MFLSIFQAVRLLKPGGTLVYSTCTIPSEENERQVAWALDKFPCLQLIKQVSNKVREPVVRRLDSAIHAAVKRSVVKMPENQLN